jgi:hypothetical protein
MKPKALLRRLTRAPLTVLCLALLALFAGMSVSYRFSLPPEVESRQYSVGVASVTALLGTPGAEIGEVDADDSALSARAELLASLLARPKVREDVARGAGLRADLLVTPRPASTGAPPAGSALTDAVISEEDRRAHIVRARVPTLGAGNVPMITVDTQAPDAAGAVELADAAIAAYAKHLGPALAAQGFQERQQVIVERLAPADAATVQRGPSTLLAGVVAIALFALGIASLPGLAWVARRTGRTGTHARLSAAPARHAPAAAGAVPPAPAAMSPAAIVYGARPHLTRPSHSHAVPVLQLFAVAVMVIPSDTVIKAIGASGYAAALVGLFAFASWVAATVFGLHNPLRTRHPIRGVLGFVWVSALASYVLMDRRLLTVTELASADRYLIQLAAVTGVALVAAECLNSVQDTRRVLRALSWGGAVCGVIASLQFWISLDLAPYLRLLPGFELNFENSGISARAALNRVAGTAIHPIELGVAAGMLLPLAIYVAMYDRDRTPRQRWAPVALISLAIPTSVSRSAILAVVASLALLIVLMPSRQRLVAVAGVPFAVVAVFMSAPGLISTLTSFFSAGTSDPSVATRVGDYPLVERLTREAPWFGHGGGTYIPDSAIDILDNQYLKAAVELGLLGMLAVAVFFVVPVIAALVARRRSSDLETRLLSAALASSALAGAVCSFTFDSLSFPMFLNIHALVIGLIGVAWRLALAEQPAGRPRAASIPSLLAGPTPVRTPEIVQPAGG